MVDIVDMVDLVDSYTRQNHTNLNDINNNSNMQGKYEQLNSDISHNKRDESITSGKYEVTRIGFNFDKFE